MDYIFIFIWYVHLSHPHDQTIEDILRKLSTRCGSGEISLGRHIFIQYMGSMPTQYREKFG